MIFMPVSPFLTYALLSVSVIKSCFSGKNFGLTTYRWIFIFSACRPFCACFSDFLKIVSNGLWSFLVYSNQLTYTDNILPNRCKCLIINLTTCVWTRRLFYWSSFLHEHCSEIILPAACWVSSVLILLYKGRLRNFLLHSTLSSSIDLFHFAHFRTSAWA